MVFRLPGDSFITHLNPFWVSVLTLHGMVALKHMLRVDESSVNFCWSFPPKSPDLAPARGLEIRYVLHGPGPLICCGNLGIAHCSTNLNAEPHLLTSRHVSIPGTWKSLENVCGIKFLHLPKTSPIDLPYRYWKPFNHVSWLAMLQPTDGNPLEDFLTMQCNPRPSGPSGMKYLCTAENTWLWYWKATKELRSLWNTMNRSLTNHETLDQFSAFELLFQGIRRRIRKTNSWMVYALGCGIPQKNPQSLPIYDLRYPATSQFLSRFAKVICWFATKNDNHHVSCRWTSQTWP